MSPPKEGRRRRERRGGRNVTTGERRSNETFAAKDDRIRMALGWPEHAGSWVSARVEAVSSPMFDRARRIEYSDGARVRSAA
jgi:hypothetical protein